MPADEELETLPANALLLVSVIGALSRTGATSSPKSDDVGWMIGQDASWVHRHGRLLKHGAGLGLATLSMNGHCFLSSTGEALARRLRSAEPDAGPPASCHCCGAERAGPCIHGRQLCGCGLVAQWCPDHVPGLQRPEVPSRSRRAQHTGMWFQATNCRRGLARCPGPEAVSETCDGTPLMAGLPVLVSYGSGARHLLGDTEGTVEASANGVAMVSWPAVGGRSAMEADIVKAGDLVLSGALDMTGLSGLCD